MTKTLETDIDNSQVLDNRTLEMEKLKLTTDNCQVLDYLTLGNVKNFGRFVYIQTNKTNKQANKNIMSATKMTWRDTILAKSMNLKFSRGFILPLPLTIVMFMLL